MGCGGGTRTSREQLAISRVIIRGGAGPGDGRLSWSSADLREGRAEAGTLPAGGEPHDSSPAAGDKPGDELGASDAGDDDVIGGMADRADDTADHELGRMAHPDRARLVKRWVAVRSQLVGLTIEARRGGPGRSQSRSVRR